MMLKWKYLCKNVIAFFLICLNFYQNSPHFLPNGTKIWFNYDNSLKVHEILLATCWIQINIHQRHNSYGMEIHRFREEMSNSINLTGILNPQNHLYNYFCWRMSICLGEEAEAARRTITRVGFEANACSLWGQRDRHFGEKLCGSSYVLPLSVNKPSLCIFWQTKQHAIIYGLKSRSIG